jgi:hypothetical protein
MFIAVNPTGATVLMRLANLQTLDVRIERRIARKTVHSCAAYPANADGTVQ